MLDELHIRREKLARLRELGIDPYPTESHRNALCAQALEHFDAWSVDQKKITLAGRLFTIRVHGGIMFADLGDDSGKIQIALKEDELGAEVFSQFRDLIDPGDIVEVQGILFKTKREEKTLQVISWRLLTKALLPLPEKWHGLQDVEIRYRERELDLLSNPEVKERFVVRSKLVASMRQFLSEQGFMEVETPVLQPMAGGASARPFITHHNALDIDLYLRIAPELYLKRLLVGGFEKIFEIARCFRNEGIDHSHNPEFTQIELYWAYAGKEKFLEFIESMLGRMLADVVKISAPFERKTFRQVVMDACGIDVDKMKTLSDIQEACKKTGADEALRKIDFSQCVGLGEGLDELYKKTARPQLLGPVWIMDYPVQMIPLAGRSPDDSTKSATAQLVWNGVEVVKAFYHELNDPLDQRVRLEEEQALIEKGSEEAQHLDEGFLTSLEHGMPPASGLGMGIDRLVSMVTNSPNLKEVILFPTLRPVQAEEPSKTE